MKKVLRKSSAAWLLCAVSAFAMTQSVQAASFDCAKAMTQVEELICGDVGLSNLDEDLAASYKAAVQERTKAESIKRAQKQWMKERNACSDTDCVKTAYQKRLQALRQAPPDGTQQKVASSAHRRKPTVSSYKLLQEEPHEPLSEICEEFTAMLNEFEPDEPLMRCEQKLHPAFPKFRPIELVPLPDTDNFKYFTAIADLSARELRRSGHSSYRTDEELKRLFHEKELLGGYRYYLLTTDRFIKNRAVTMLVQERQGDCRVRHTAMDGARRIAYEWDAKTESVVRYLFSFQSIFTFEGESLQGNGLLFSDWNEAELPTSSGKDGGIWLKQADKDGYGSRICTIVFSARL